MAIVKRVEIVKKTDIQDAVKYQILTHCFFNKVQISTADLNCLSLLAMLKEHELTDFCKIAVTNSVFKSPQSARNAITKSEKKGLIKSKVIIKKP